MSDFLETIFLRTKADLAERRRALPLAELARQAEQARAPKDFLKAFAPAKSPRVIAELKKASPSLGMIRPDFSPRALARDLAQAGAAALSVLTEPHYFLGSPDYLRAAVGETDIPVLRKDFLFDEYQVVEARAWGASAILLIAAMIDDKTMTRLRRCAEDNGMHALCEVHTQEELVRTLNTGAKIVGVNCRDLKTFNVDPERTRALIGEIPSEVVAIAESGIQTRADMDAFTQLGARGFLVGTALMKTPRPGETLQKLLA